MEMARIAHRVQAQLSEVIDRLDGEERHRLPADPSLDEVHEAMVLLGLDLVDVVSIGSCGYLDPSGVPTGLFPFRWFPPRGPQL